jgi:SAM-dependent methyltransferase
MPLDAAIAHLRSDPAQAQMVEDVYLGADVDDSARRFASSLEFDAVRALLGDRIHGARVMDLGSGVGIAARALSAAGASVVYALEPDPSDLVGWSAMRRGALPTNVHIFSAFADPLPLASGSLDIIYTRQVLHHIPDLPAAMRECARVLRPGGMLVACREHVINDAAQKEVFLQRHPVHRLAGGENAYTLGEYTGAITGAGLQLEQVLGPWDSPINAWPSVRTSEEFANYATVLLVQRFGRLGRMLARVPGIPALVRRWSRREWPGRPYTFVATRPG